MWIALLTPALAAPAPAGTLDLQLRGPDGGALRDGEVALPWTGSFDHVEGDETWRFEVSAAAPGGALDLLTSVYRVKGEKLKLRHEQREQLSPETDGAWTVSTSGLSWTLDARWALTPSPPPLADAPPEGWSTSRHALVWDDAPLYESPGGPEQERRRALPEGRQAPSVALSPYRIVADWGVRYYESETVPQALEAHCHAGAAPSRAYPYQHYIAVEDTAPALTAPIALTFDDGTGVAFAAGVAAIPAEGVDGRAGEAGRYTLYSGGLAIELELPEGAVGPTYRPSPHFDISRRVGAVSPAEVMGEAAAGPVRYSGDAALDYHGRVGVRDPIVILRTPCAELHVRVDGARLQP